MVMVSLPSIGFAGTYWVSPTGTATWGNCSGPTPLSGTSACSLSAANTNASAGDIINLRGGTYNTAINPSRSGSGGNVITFQAYSNQIVIITDTTPIGPYKMGIRLSAKSYIKIDGITFNNPLNRPLEFTWGASYNEIKNCTFNSLGILRIWDGYPSITEGTPCVHNWFHHNVFANSGQVSAGCDDWNGFQIGVPAYDKESNHQTIENNVFYGGGHHNLETFTKYNIIRNNVFHHEGSMTAPNPPCPYGPDTNGKYGNRNIQIYDGHNEDGKFNLIEGNRFGHAGPPPDDDGGDGFTLTAPKNIVRYNAIFNALNNGLLL